MIGQQKLIDKLNKWNELPRFMIFNGIKGCGKKTLAKELAHKYGYELILIDNKVDEIRDMIKLSKEYDTNILFFIDNGNKMSIQAENTLLKVTEETPNNSYIILGVENKDLLLPTIISRGTVFNFQEYEEKDYIQWEIENGKDKDFTLYPLSQVYPNLSYLEILPIEKGKDLLDLCIKIADSIRVANGANAFKITENIQVKSDQEGYDLTQFLWCLKSVCLSKLKKSLSLMANSKVPLRNEEIECCYMKDYLSILTELQKMLSNSLFNKAYILDKLIIDFKAVYYE